MPVRSQSLRHYTTNLYRFRKSKKNKQVLVYLQSEYQNISTCISTYCVSLISTHIARSILGVFYVYRIIGCISSLFLKVFPVLYIGRTEQQQNDNFVSYSSLIRNFIKTTKWDFGRIGRLVWTGLDRLGQQQLGDLCDNFTVGSLCWRTVVGVFAWKLS